MKNLLLPAFLIISITAFSQVVKKKAVYSHFKTFYVDLNNDNKPDTIVLSSSLPNKKYFNRISISMSGAKRTVFKAKEYWAEFEKDFFDTNLNLIKSTNIFVKKTPKHAVIMLTSGTDTAGVGYGVEFSIINIENNTIKMVFDYGPDDKDFVADVEIPTKLTDLEHNDRLCFVFTDYVDVYKAVTGGNIGAYSPYEVYLVDDSCKFNERLSKSYNEKYYVKLGPEDGNDVEIFYPNDKKLKPSIWKKQKRKK